MFPAVYRQAISSKMFEADMKIQAMHVKKRQLHQLLPSLVMPKRRKVRQTPISLSSTSDQPTASCMSLTIQICIFSWCF